MKRIKYGISALLLTLMLAFSGSLLAKEVNINSADAQTIAESLNGVGLKKAEAIVAWRTEHGKFTDLASLEQVKGIAQKTVEKNKDNIQF